MAIGGHAIKRFGRLSRISTNMRIFSFGTSIGDVLIRLKKERFNGVFQQGIQNLRLIWALSE
jgi:hypothetical protein